MLAQRPGGAQAGAVPAPVRWGRKVVAGRERSKKLCEQYPVYSLKDPDSGRVSPLLENPLCLFDREKYGQLMETAYGIRGAR